MVTLMAQPRVMDDTIEQESSPSSDERRRSSRRGSIAELFRTKRRLLFGATKECQFDENEPACAVSDNVEKTTRFRRLSMAFRRRLSMEGPREDSRWRERDQEATSNLAAAAAPPTAPCRKNSMETTTATTVMLVCEKIEGDLNRSIDFESERVGKDGPKFPSRRASIESPPEEE